MKKVIITIAMFLALSVTTFATTKESIERTVKEKSFAANVNRDEINDAMQRANVSLDEIILFIIAGQGQVQ